ncbi:tRNA dihydrouridine synthase [Microbotryomycetes sp. JL201]|nr:tRNA dihydrouridine synthase [Microbotryomycetes sp. JL201]
MPALSAPDATGIMPPAPSAPPATAAPVVPALPDQPGSDHTKLGGHEFWQSIGSPKYVVAPMVNQSELAWRVLSRLHGATLAYTPMFHAVLFGSHNKYIQDHFDMHPDSIEGVAPYDRPLVVQFCANDKDAWLAAAEKVVGRCDAVDLNLGCPQGIAKKGRYGAFLMEEWDLIRSMISHLHRHLAIPVIAKLRVYPALDKTLQYASHVFGSGAQLVTVHGRTREAKGRMAGFASWPKIRAVADLLGRRVPVLANGGVPSADQVEPCLKETGSVGVMSAEGNLYNPMIFSPCNAAGGREYRKCLPQRMRQELDTCDEQLEGEWDHDLAAYGPAVWLADQYLAIVRTLPHTETACSAIKSHMFKLFRPAWAAEKHLDLREMLGRAGSGRNVEYMQRVKEYQEFVDEFRRRFKGDRERGDLPTDSNKPLTSQEVAEKYGGNIPFSHAQPYMRVVSAEEPAEAMSDKRARDVEVQGTISGRADIDDHADKRLRSSDTGTSITAPATAPCIGATRGVEPCEFHKQKLVKEEEKRVRKKQMAKLQRDKKNAANKVKRQQQRELRQQQREQMRETVA